MRVNTSASQTFGSMSLSLAVMMSVFMTAALSAPRSEPANNHAFLPRARPRRARSAALFVRQISGGPTTVQLMCRIAVSIRRLPAAREVGSG